MSNASAGRVLLIPKGDYNSGTTYSRLDVVLYEHNSYVAKQTTTGNLPTNTTYWQPLTDIEIDDTLSGSSTNAIQNKAVYDGLDDLKQTLTDEVSTRAQLGAHNLLNYILSDVKSYNTGGTWNDNVLTVGGTLTATFNTDKSITLNGSISTNINIRLTPTADLGFNGMRCTMGVNNNGVAAYIYDDTLGTGIFDNTKDGFIIPSNYHNYRILVRITANASFSNLTIYPMVLDANDSNRDYQPYAETNQQLTHNKVSWEDNVLIGAHQLFEPIEFTHNDVAITKNADNSFNAVGTASTSATSIRIFNPKAVLTKGTYRIKYLDATNTASAIRIAKIVGGNWSTLVDVAKGDSAYFTLDEDDISIGIMLIQAVTAGESVSITNIKLLITSENDNSNDFSLVAMTNRMLTKKISPFGFEVLNLSTTSIASLLASADINTFKVIAFYNAPTDAPSGTGNGFGMVLLIKAAEDVGYARAIYMVNSNYFMGQYDKTNNVITWSKLTTT